MTNDANFWADAVSEWSDSEPTAVTVVDAEPLPALNSPEWAQIMQERTTV